MRRRAAKARHSACYWGLAALLHNGYGQYGKALAAARQACEHEDVMVYGSALVELIEAGVRDGQPDEAAAALDRLRERTQASGTEWALGVEARCRGAAAATTRRCYQRVDRAARAQPRGVRARAEPARVRRVAPARRTAARTRASSSRAAHESFSHMGADAFAERARRELLATGETARRRTADTRDALTPQELQVARLARDGHTNPEIGAQLFISPRTVEYHLRKVFGKLGVKNRKDLREALADGSRQALVDYA